MISTLNDSVPVIEAVGLSKIFRDFWLRSKAIGVDKLDLRIERGELYGLLGPNGSGKSTTIKMILGLLRPSRGRLLVFGREPSDVAVKQYIGFLPEESYLYRFLDGRETLDFYGRLFGLNRIERRKRTEELLEMVGLDRVAHRPVGEYSKGMMRRIGIAQALINDPEFLILDEPTSGLDPIGTRQVKELLMDLRQRGKTILLSSHLLADVEDICDRMSILFGGQKQAEGKAKDLLIDENETVIHSPKLKKSTIEKISKLVKDEEGLDLGLIEAPRQRLEKYFIGIVEKASSEKTQTSGASQGGSTPEFLKTDSEEADNLIAQLVKKDKKITGLPDKKVDIKPSLVEDLTEEGLSDHDNDLGQEVDEQFLDSLTDKTNEISGEDS